MGLKIADAGSNRGCCATGGLGRTARQRTLTQKGGELEYPVPFPLSFTPPLSYTLISAGSARSLLRSALDLLTALRLTLASLATASLASISSRPCSQPPRSISIVFPQTICSPKLKTGPPRPLCTVCSSPHQLPSVVAELTTPPALCALPSRHASLLLCDRRGRGCHHDRLRLGLHWHLDRFGLV